MATCSQPSAPQASCSSSGRLQPRHQLMQLRHRALATVGVRAPARQGRRSIRTNAKAQAPQPDVIAVQEYADALEIGPAFEATLQMLEWKRVCTQVSEFASTHAGKRSCQNMVVPEDDLTSYRLLEHTRAMITLEFDFATSLDFGGIKTSDAESGLNRAAKGGMLIAEQLRAIVTLVNGADRLRKQILIAARENSAADRDSPIMPLIIAVGKLVPKTYLVRQITTAIDEDGVIQDLASEQLRGLRMRVKQLQQRMTGILKGYGGEVSDKGGRMCVALPGGTKVPNGVVLGQAAGGSIVYVEPSSVVQYNNELGAARAEAQAAEEAVLWSLSSAVMDVQEELSRALKVVAWLDTLCAKARYGTWIEGVLPEFVPWDTLFHARGAGARRRSAQEEEELDADGLNPDQRYALRLRNLRHPLLYADYLKQRQSLEKLVRAGGGSVGGRSSTRRVLSNRREGTLRDAGFSGSDSDNEYANSGGGSNGVSSSGGGGGASGSGAGGAGAVVEVGEDATPGQRAEAMLARLTPPRPLDLTIKPDTSVVVITGPNTGGKTATMKALGLTVCMAKVGLPVPADAPARMPCFTSVLADIGDEQSLTANLSTFSGHLRRIQALRAEADGKCLVLLDELGTGTDPLEGAALGLALLKKLVKGGIGSGALTIATTHHSVMTGLKFEDGRFENASVEFDEVALAPTYKLLWGIPGRSNALNIAQRLGLNEEVVAAARARLDTSVADVNSAIGELEATRDALTREEDRVWALDRELRDLKNRVRTSKRAVQDLQSRLGAARTEALLQVYRRAFQRYRALRDARAKARPSLPGASPTPKPPAASAAVAAPTAPSRQAGAEEVEEFELYGSEVDAKRQQEQAEAQRSSSYVASEEEVWEAWEAAQRRQAELAEDVREEAEATSIVGTGGNLLDNMLQSASSSASSSAALSSQDDAAEDDRDDDGFADELGDLIDELVASAERKAAAEAEAEAAYDAALSQVEELLSARADAAAVAAAADRAVALAAEQEEYDRLMSLLEGGGGEGEVLLGGSGASGSGGGGSSVRGVASGQQQGRGAGGRGASLYDGRDVDSAVGSMSGLAGVAARAAAMAAGGGGSSSSSSSHYAAAAVPSSSGQRGAVPDDDEDYDALMEEAESLISAMDGAQADARYAASMAAEEEETPRSGTTADPAAASAAAVAAAGGALGSGAGVVTAGSRSGTARNSAAGAAKAGASSKGQSSPGAGAPRVKQQRTEAAGGPGGRAQQQQQQQPQAQRAGKQQQQGAQPTAKSKSPAAAGTAAKQPSQQQQQQAKGKQQGRGGAGSKAAALSSSARSSDGNSG